jgi:hypothetical protein
MTLVRRAAVRISEKVVQRASPGNREWAEGLAREIAFIEGDWRALGWAIGSLRVLFLNPPKRLRTVSEIARAGRIFAGRREHTPPVIFLVMVMQTFSNGLLAVLPIRRHGPLDRTGFAVAAVSAAYLAVVGWMESRMRERPENMDDWAWIEFYRGEMVRLRDLYAGFGAVFSVAIVLLCAGSALGVEWLTGPFLPSGLIALCMFVARPFSRPRQSFQRKLDNVDSILQQSGREA